MWDLKITALLREGKGPGESSADFPISAQFAHLKQQVLNLIAHVLMLTPADNRNFASPFSQGKKAIQKN